MYVPLHNLEMIVAFMLRLKIYELVWIKEVCWRTTEGKVPPPENMWRTSDKCAIPDEWRAMVGKTFRHHKGRLYKLLGFAPHSETLEPLAVYQLLYGDFGLWTRPAAMFFDRVEKDAKSVPRFDPI